MRDQIFARIRPLAEDLAEQLTTMLMERVDALVDQMKTAFDVALSSFASDLSVTDGAARQYDVRDEGRVGRAATQPRSRRVDTTRVNQPRSAQADTESGAAAAAVALADTKPSSNRALQQGQDLPPSTSLPHKRTNTCRKCGAVGFTSRTCGKTHNVSTSPAEEEGGEEETPTTLLETHRPAQPPATSSIQAPPPNRPKRIDRFALIEAAAEKRREREERASRRRASGMEPGGGPEGGVEGPGRTDAEPEVEVSVATRATFVVDPM